MEDQKYKDSLAAYLEDRNKQTQRYLKYHELTRKAESLEAELQKVKKELKDYSDIHGAEMFRRYGYED